MTLCQSFRSIALGIGASIDAYLVLNFSYAITLGIVGNRGQEQLEVPLPWTGGLYRALILLFVLKWGWHYHNPNVLWRTTSSQCVGIVCPLVLCFHLMIWWKKSMEFPFTEELQHMNSYGSTYYNRTGYPGQVIGAVKEGARGKDYLFLLWVGIALNMAHVAAPIGNPGYGFDSRADKQIVLFLCRSYL